MSILLDYLHILGWVAAAFSVIAAFVRTMIPLRIMSLWSNFAKITYAVGTGSLPSLVEYSILLPLNLFRLIQMRRLISDIRHASTSGLNAEWLSPFADGQNFMAGDVLFRKGDLGDRLYYLCHGTIRFPEIGVEIGEGTLFGELAFFTKDGRRTQTAECRTDCRVLSIDQTRLEQLYFQNPRFGWFLVQLIAQRLTDNAARVAKPGD